MGSGLRNWDDGDELGVLFVVWCLIESVGGFWLRLGLGILGDCGQHCGWR